MLPRVPTARFGGQSWARAALALFLVIQGAFVLWTATSPPRHAAWSHLIASPLWPAYTDLQIMATGWQEDAAGLDPLRTDADAPRFNYPRLWLLGGRLGWDTSDVPWLGGLTAALFLAAVYVTARRAPVWTGLLALLLLSSPAINLGLERGNSDLLLFTLVTPALLADPSLRHWRSLGAPWLLVLAGMLKLFPFAALPAVLIRAHRAVWISALLGGLVFAAYLIHTREDISLALAKTQRGITESYGLALTAIHLPTLEGPTDSTAAPDPANARQLAGALLLLIVAGLGWRKTRPWLLGAPPATPATAPDAPAAAVRLFVAGAAIYLLTFLFAHNWAYRLIFLLWTLPWLGHELTGSRMRRRLWAALALLLMTAVCWGTSAHSPALLAWTHLAALALVPVLILITAAALESIRQARPAATAPAWFKPHRAFAAAALAASAVLIAGDLGSLFTKRGFSSSRPAELWDHLQRGEAALANGNTVEAIARFQSALQIEPDHADAHVGIGKALCQSGHPDEARTHLEKALARHPRAIAARTILASILRQQRRWDEAIALYHEVLALRPGHIATINHLALTHLESGRPADALTWLEQASQLRPDHAETQRNLGIVAAALRNPDAAALHFKRALELKPDYADAELQWGFVLARSGRLQEALPHFQRAVALAPASGQAHFVLAMALRELGQANEAELHHREALRLEPSLTRR